MRLFLLFACLFILFARCTSGDSGRSSSKPAANSKQSIEVNADQLAARSLRMTNGEFIKHLNTLKQQEDQVYDGTVKKLLVADPYENAADHNKRADSVAKIAIEAEGAFLRSFLDTANTIWSVVDTVEKITYDPNLQMASGGHPYWRGYDKKSQMTFSPLDVLIGDQTIYYEPGIVDSCVSPYTYHQFQWDWYSSSAILSWPNISLSPEMARKHAVANSNHKSVVERIFKIKIVRTPMWYRSNIPATVPQAYFLAAHWIMDKDTVWSFRRKIVPEDTLNVFSLESSKL
jgi:hypothetical protein